MKVRLTYAEAISRIAHMLQAVIASEEWGRHSQTFATSDWMDGREPFRRFFDVYEDGNHEEWLGIMEWAVLEEMRACGPGLADNAATENRIIARMAAHPNIELTG